MGGTKTGQRITGRRRALVLFAAIGMLFFGSAIHVSSAEASNSVDFSVVAGNSESSTSPSSSGSSALSTYLRGPNDVIVDSYGNLVISDTRDNEVEVLARSSDNPGYVLAEGTNWQTGNLYIIAGAGTSPTAPASSGSSALSTELNSPEGISVDQEGDVVVADTGSNLVAVIAVSSANPGYQVPSWTRGDIYAIAGDGDTFPNPTSTGSSAITVGLDAPVGIAVDLHGNILISDTFASEIAALAVSGVNPGYPIGSTSTWTVGDLYEIAGGGSTSPSEAGVSSQQAELNAPEGIAVSEGGNVVFADEQNNEVDLLSISSNNSGFSSISSWTQGNVYVLAGGGTNTPSLSGVTASLSELDAPSSVSVDGDGNVLIANSYENEIDLLAEGATNPGYSLGSDWKQDEVYLLIGSGTVVPSASGANATSIALGDPEGVNVGSDGSVFVADSSHNEVEQLDLAPSAPILTSPNVSTDSAQLSWSSPTRDGGMPISGYDVLVFDGSSTPLTTMSLTSNVNDTTVTGLASGASYEFEVEALNAIGVGAASNEIVVATGSIPEVTGSGSPPGVSDSKPNPDLTTPRLRLELKVFDAEDSMSAGFVTLIARCLYRSCAGTVILKGLARVNDDTNGGRHSIAQTFIAGSSHFSMRGTRSEKILVPLTQYARRVVESGRLIDLRGVFSVKNGGKGTFRVRVVNRSTSRPGDSPAL